MTAGFGRPHHSSSSSSSSSALSIASERNLAGPNCLCNELGRTVTVGYATVFEVKPNMSPGGLKPCHRDPVLASTVVKESFLRTRGSFSNAACSNLVPLLRSATSTTSSWISGVSMELSCLGQTSGSQGHEPWVNFKLLPPSRRERPTHPDLVATPAVSGMTVFSRLPSLHACHPGDDFLLFLLLRGSEFRSSQSPKHVEARGSQTSVGSVATFNDCERGRDRERKSDRQSFLCASGRAVLWISRAVSMGFRTLRMWTNHRTELRSSVPLPCSRPEICPVLSGTEEASSQTAADTVVTRLETDTPGVCLSNPTSEHTRDICIGPMVTAMQIFA
ncbi:hypothetical protein INR49_013988 [Caranx melampygus]|nr:hypothetical protein INR49_013988 [Caranx melampygus]